MNISELSIKRPVTIIMCMLIIIVLGIVSFLRVPIDLMPSMDIPMAIVMTTYEGVGPEEVENFVTENIESAVSTVNNLKSIQSQTSEGSSIVIVEFNDGTDMDFATLQMREKIDLVKRALPDGVDNPMVLKLDPNMMPIAQLGVTSEKIDDVELKRITEDTVKARLERLEGVASVNITGGVEREIKVELDPSKMSGYGVTLSQVTSLLQTENVNLPGGSVEYGSKNLIIKSKGEFTSVEDIKNIPITLPQGGVVYLRDISQVTDGFKENSTLTRMSQQNSIGISIQKQTTANTAEVVNLVKKEITRIQNEYPEVKVNIVFDQGKYIEQSISNVSSNALVGGVLAVLILFIFLRNVRTTLIIGIAIPVSVISTFILMFASNTSLNMISMGGLALGVGMMVDNSIVVLENIFRHRQMGKSRVQAALDGAKEVGGAIVASTLTTVVVFVPIIFTEGIAAQIFKQMALTVTFSLLASLAVALTIVPMLSSKMLRVSKDANKRKNVLDKIFDAWGRFFDSLDNLYRNMLNKVLKYRKFTLMIGVGIFVLSIVAIPLIGLEFIPASDEGQFSVDISMPEGTLLDETDKVTMQIEEIISKIPELEKAFVSVGGGGSMAMSGSGDSHKATINATLVSKSDRKRSTSVIVEEVRNQVEKIPGADISVSEVSSMGGGSGGMGGMPVSIEISGYDLDQLREISAEIEKKVSEVEGTRQVESSISKGKPEAQIYVDRNKASQYGITTSQVASTVSTALQGKVATQYRINGDEVDIRVMIPEEARKTFNQLKDIKITSANGAVVLLGDVVKIELEEGPVTIARKNQTRYVTVTSELFNRDLGSVTRDVQEKLKDVQLPEGYSIKYGGQNEQMMDSFTSLALALLLSILLIYMVMAAQFESLLQPFIIMFAVPLAFSGAAIGLAITRRTFNVASFIGIIILAGIVVNNAIILIDYINQQRDQGMERNEAIIKAGPTRLRPILMTTLTTVLGMVPMALGIGEGSEVQAPMATVVIFGLLMSTMLTLLVVPVIYTVFDDMHKKFINRKVLKKQAAITQ